MNDSPSSTLPEKPAIPKPSDGAAILAGSPIAAVGVLLFEAHYGVKLETAAAAAVGAVFAGLVGYLWKVGTYALNVWIERSLAK